ncbi:hypothetical protein [Bacteroides rodentium]
MTTCIEAATREYGFRLGKSTSRKEVNTEEELTGWLPSHHDGVKSALLGKEGNEGKEKSGKMAEVCLVRKASGRIVANGGTKGYYAAKGESYNRKNGRLKWI